MIRTVIATAWLLVAATINASAADWYLSASGSDTTTSGSYNRPFRSFAYAQNYVKAGDSLIVRNGTHAYATSQIFVGYGTATKPITIRAENDYQATIKGPLNVGSNLYDPPTPTSNINLLVVAGTHITVRGLYITRSTGIGLLLAGDGVKGQYLVSNEHWGTAIEISPAYGLSTTSGNSLTGCYVNAAVLANSPSHRTVGGWPAAIIAKRALNCVFDGNTSEYNYGEGLCFSICSGGAMRNNAAGDNWSTNLYLDNSEGTAAAPIQVTGNRIANRGDGRFQRYGYNGIGITLAVENLAGSTWIKPTRHVSLSGNSVSNAAYGIFFPAWEGIPVTDCAVQRPTFSGQAGVWSNAVQLDYNAGLGFYSGPASNYRIRIY